jgi:RNA-directed DNA polymerase
MRTVCGPSGDREQRHMPDHTCDMTVLELFQAYYDCRQTKRNTESAWLFETRLERNLMDLYHELHSGEYRPGRSICFVVEHPKVREVWAAEFRDRIVHHVLYNRIADRFHRRFIHDSYACIPGKGALAAVERMEAMARSLTHNHTRPGFVLKMDVANFFVSIDRHTLETQLARHVTEPWWMALCRTVLHHDPTRNAHVKSPPWLLKRVPPHKSLFHASPGRGLPIGNLSSQFFANVYLNDLDQHAKHVLKVKRWVRYMDDVVALSDDAPALAALSVRVDAFLRDHLSLQLHPNKTSINRLEHGFDALGFVIRPHARYVRRSTVHKAINQIDGMCRSRQPVYDIAATANSYFGLLRSANAWRTRTRLAQLLRRHGHLVSPTLNRMFKGVPA